MKLLTLLFALCSGLYAQLSVAVTYPYIADLTKTVGGEHVEVQLLSAGHWDPHFIVPKPSLVGKVRSADLLITNGADLEIGWLPPLLSRASNNALAQKNHILELSKSVRLIDVPADTSRAGGDVHAEGNPHFHLDPRNIPLLADAIETFLSTNDPTHKHEYQKNNLAFKQTWSLNLKRWESQMAPLRGKSVIQYHPVFNYFLRAYGLKSVATIEPLAGIPPSASHALKLITLINEQKPFTIMHDVYHSTKTAKFLQDKSAISITLSPHDVGAMSNVTDLTKLFDTLIGNLR